MLMELLVVILIVGILAAIALPSFLGQKGKAIDAQAQSLVRIAQTAAETIAVDNNGFYDHVSGPELNRVEPSIKVTASTTQAYVSAATGSRDEYAVTARATNGDELTVRRGALGEVTRTCVSPLTKTGCSGGERSTW
jgi:type IV pilus assembly protein PilA